MLAHFSSIEIVFLFKNLLLKGPSINFRWPIMACSGGGPLKGHFCKREQVGSNENVIPKRKLSNIVVRGKD